ncbi:autophagy-related protein 101-like [Hydractinia symbiolongicarpus]|uniref:autophagy-related protein 101-like n=1 Tax=Hydractinia symbiolongicarpus TaxID=13093 RepID=UPI00254CAC5F|nr:autophagy-related protein 101-like [Hydractinia symbiolongicarpus]
MNARSQVFEFTVELSQVEEVVCSILHTLLFHRSTGKFHYQQQGSYTIGTIGFEDVDCQFIDCTYVRCSSDKLHKNVQKQARQFKDALKSMDGYKNGQLSLEFYQKRKSPWPFPTESVPWELWVLKFEVVHMGNENERNILHEKLTDNVNEKIRTICQIVNQPEYIPKMPNEPDLTNVFDDQYDDVQPYLHRVSFQTGEYSSEMTMGNTMRKLLKDTFNY